MLFSESDRMGMNCEMMNGETDINRYKSSYAWMNLCNNVVKLEALVDVSNDVNYGILWSSDDASTKYFQVYATL
jgi:hypothetical protein